MTSRPPDAIPIETRRPSALYRALSVALLRLETWVRSRGSVRIRRFTHVFWAVVAAIGVLLLFGPVINKPLSFEDITSSADTATETWIARSFTADFTLHRGDDGRMRMEVVERIDAFFPDDVSERGIERVISSQYESHDLAPTVTKATFDGEDLTWSSKHAATTTTIRLDTGAQLQGDHEFVVHYTLHDVVYAEVNESTQRQEELLEWDAFGPVWPHGVAHSELSVTLPKDLVDAYSRQPSGGIAWLLLSASDTLTPDSETADTVTYGLVNDQNIPPHATFWFEFRFAPGTFAMPPPSFLYWVQVVGPFVPLILLAATLLFVFAARAVAWGDARGRAWFVSHDRAPKNVSPAVAVRVWGAVHVAPLVAAIATFQRSDSAAARRTLVREASRVGRLGNLRHAVMRWGSDPSWKQQFSEKLRRVPHGFVRDSFFGAALALPVLQWGLVRQLSFQLPLSIYWWPVAIVVVTILVAIVIIVVTDRAMPLTRRGALLKEFLMGLELFVRQTSSDERTTLRDPLLPYAVMFARPARSRAWIRRLLDEEGIPNDVRDDPDFVSGPRLAVRTASVLALLATIALAIWVPASTRDTATDAIYDGDIVPGDYGVFVQDFAADATLVPTGDGRVRLVAEERIHADVGSGYREIPQVLRQWRDVVDGHDTGLSVLSVTIDGDDVPFTVSRMQGMALLQSHVPDEWPGAHDIVVRYELADAIGAVRVGNEWRDQLRWTALNPGWDFGLDPEDFSRRNQGSIHVQLRMPAEMADDAIGMTGWLDYTPRESVAVAEFDARAETDAEVVYDIAYAPDETGWWGHTQYSYLGAQLQFAEGSFQGPSQLEWHLFSFVAGLPITVPIVLAALVVGSAVCGIIAFRNPQRRRGGVLLDAARWVPPWLTAAQFVTLFWATPEMSGDEPAFIGIVSLLGISIAATIVVLYVTRRRNAAA